MSDHTPTDDQAPASRFGWAPNPAGVAAVLASLPHPGELAAAAPHWMGDGLTGDLLPFLAYYEVEVPGWKPKASEPPYHPQSGNNCTSEGLMHCLDLLQFMAVATGEADAAGNAVVFQRTCVEACYAFGLAKAGMRGDSGCYGGAMAKGALEIGAVPYRDVELPHEETRSRLVQWANDPASVVQALGTKAAPYKVGSIARVTTWDEFCAAIANGRLVTLASNVGYQVPRDEKGICRRAGSWNHQMAGAGVIRSDGVETGVILQSWGPNQPTGPTPFRLPTFAFRAHRQDVEAQLAQGDSWSIGAFPGFERKPLPARWTYQDYI
jgi:hypothetical protein